MTDSVEFMRMLPTQFVDAYEALCVDAFNSGGGMDGASCGVMDEHGDGGAVEAAVVGKANGQAVGQWRTSSGQATSIGAVRPGKASFKKLGKTSKGLKTEKSFNAKRKVDKRLRQIAREIFAVLEGTPSKSGNGRVCTGRCKRLGDSDWLYCPNCSGPMGEV